MGSPQVMNELLLTGLLTRVHTMQQQKQLSVRSTSNIVVLHQQFLALLQALPRDDQAVLLGIAENFSLAQYKNRLKASGFTEQLKNITFLSADWEYPMIKALQWVAKMESWKHSKHKFNSKIDKNASVHEAQKNALVLEILEKAEFPSARGTLGLWQQRVNYLSQCGLATGEPVFPKKPEAKLQILVSDMVVSLLTQPIGKSLVKVTQSHDSFALTMQLISLLPKPERYLNNALKTIFDKEGAMAFHCDVIAASVGDSVGQSPFQRKLSEDSTKRVYTLVKDTMLAACTQSKNTLLGMVSLLEEWHKGNKSLVSDSYKPFIEAITLVLKPQLGFNTFRTKLVLPEENCDLIQKAAVSALGELLEKKGKATIEKPTKAIISLNG
jgi:hypothetical protein